MKIQMNNINSFEMLNQQSLFTIEVLKVTNNGLVMDHLYLQYKGKSISQEQVIYKRKQNQYENLGQEFLRVQTSNQNISLLQYYAAA
ncbi:unnamed protein product [Paramecium octaurelia]|uniref:Uncharacterized protein n=1 Tax=Paramecium octaurelia TaxID=43137 RepID=A0A8S1XLL0_PAROT|nr:unnamed protein product [Paramecium octaurelia]